MHASACQSTDFSRTVCSPHLQIRHPESFPNPKESHKKGIGIAYEGKWNRTHRPTRLHRQQTSWGPPQRDTGSEAISSCVRASLVQAGKGWKAGGGSTAHALQRSVRTAPCLMGQPVSIYTSEKRARGDTQCHTKGQERKLIKKRVTANHLKNAGVPRRRIVLSICGRADRACWTKSDICCIVYLAKSKEKRKTDLAINHIARHPR